MADALASGDVARGTAAATASLACWIPLFASAENDPRLTVRLLQIAARPPAVTTHVWWLLAYPLGVAIVALAVLALLTFLVLPEFESIFDGFGIQLPFVTRMALGLRPIFERGWPLIIITGAPVALAWAVAVRWSARSVAAIASFTRSLARLVAAEVPIDEALVLAGRAAGATGLDLASPRRPLTFAAAAALDYAPRSAAVLLDAIADCHDDRGRGRLDAAAWFLGPVLIGAVGLIVGFLTLALFMPLIRLVQDLS
jgi:type IV pilus assembly protein PilC